MNYLNNPEREPLIQKILSAATMPEVQDALGALRGWRQRYPDDWGILDAGEQLSLIEDALWEDNSLPGMSPLWTPWQRLEYQVMGAQSFPEITAARRDLRQWVENHPQEAKGELVETFFLLLEVMERQLGVLSSARIEREPAGHSA